MLRCTYCVPTALRWLSAARYRWLLVVPTPFRSWAANDWPGTALEVRPQRPHPNKAAPQACSLQAEYTPHPAAAGWG